MNYSGYPFYISFDEIGTFNFCTTRYGGFSLFPFESCNTGFNTDDNPQSVIQNRIICASRLCISIERFVFLKQIHSDIVHYVTKNDCGNALQVSDLEGDGMFTDHPGVCLAITLADCVGIIVYDPENHIAGICHSGWKGSLLNICGKLVDNMVKSCRSRPQKLFVCLSPSICYKCYCVSCGLAEKFQKNYPDFVIKKDGRWHLDLKGIVTHQLIEKGINRKNIFSSDICTYENTHIFYSHRAEKNTGRFLFGVSL